IGDKSSIDGMHVHDRLSRFLTFEQESPPHAHAGSPTNLNYPSMLEVNDQAQLKVKIVASEEHKCNKACASQQKHGWRFLQGIDFLGHGTLDASKATDDLSGIRLLGQIASQDARVVAFSTSGWSLHS